MAYTSTRRSAKSSAKYIYCMGQTKGYVPLNTSRLSRLQLRQTGVFLQLLLYIYICTEPADARPAWPDLQTHGRTHRRADGHAEARTYTQTDTQKHGRRRPMVHTVRGWKNLPDASCVWTNAQGPSRCTIVAVLPHGHVHYSLLSILIHRLQPNLPNPTNLSPHSAAQRKGRKRWKRWGKRRERRLRDAWTERRPRTTGAPRTARGQGNTWTSRPCGNIWPPGCSRRQRRAWSPWPGWASRRTGTPGTPHR